LPLDKKLKKRLHIEVARLQDELIEVLYDLDKSLVLHRGTAIWRCYAGNRFSEDLDLYSSNIERLESFKEKATSRGLEVRKWKKTENLVFCKIANEITEVRIEVNFKKKTTPVVAAFEKTDSSFIDVLTLSPEDLILEKISAFNSRRLVRDAYDIYHLSNYVKDYSILKPVVLEFLTNTPQPLDEENLKTIVFTGAVPTFKQIKEAIERRFS
jgi:predicted nucleotidyltransferase component of viral defense system